MDEIQNKVLVAVDHLLEYWEDEKSKNADENENEKNIAINEKRIINEKNEKNLPHIKRYEEKVQEKRKTSENELTNCNFQKKRSPAVISRMTVHDLTVDPAERAQIMFLHPMIRQEKEKALQSEKEEEEEKEKEFLWSKKTLG